MRASARTWLALIALGCNHEATDPSAEPLALNQSAPPRAFELSLRAPVRGARLTFAADGLPPGATVTFLTSDNVGGPGSCPPQIAPACLDLANPFRRLGRAIVGPTGSATLTVLVDATFAPTQEFQAYARLGNRLYLSNSEIADTLAPTADNDADGVENADEVRDGTDPLLADTDGDGLDDGAEIAFGSDALDPDVDADGLTDSGELAASTDPNLADTDADGLDDGQEVLDVGTDPLDEDTDGDLIDDGTEVEQLGTDPLDVDTDDDGLEDGVEHIGPTDPLDPDSDDDGLDDLDEVNRGTAPNRADSDLDGLADGPEITAGTDPLDSDSDDDGVNDGDEVANGSNPLAADSDGDGADDGEEAAEGTNPLDTDTDDDGLGDNAEDGTGTNPTVADTDGGGALDGAEVASGTNPLDPADDGPGQTIGPRLLLVEVCDHATQPNARFVQIYNSGDEPANLNGWSIVRYSNGNTVGTNLALTTAGVVAPGASWVVAASSSTVNGFNFYFGAANQYNAGINGNGNDVYALALSGTIVDVYGVIGVDGVGTAWEYTDRVAKRLPTVFEPSTIWTAAEWTITAGDATAAPFDRN